MTTWTMARRRVDAVRGNGDSGFALIFVMCVIAFTTLLVTSMTVVTGSEIVPSVQSAYNQAAAQAAQGGLQAFIAYVDGNCSGANATVPTCNLPSNVSGVTAISLPDASSGYTATYSWVAQKDPSNRYFRVKSTGRVTQGGVSSTRTVIGDVIGGASTNILNYGVVTGFESQSSSDVLSSWPARQIALSSTAIDAADVPVKGSCGSGAAQNYTCINWSGASPGTAAGKVAICNATFDAKGGRSNNLPPNAPNPYVDWTEQGLNGDNYTHFAPCQTSWGTQTELIAPANPANGAGGYYSNDAILVSNSYPGGTGPTFNQPVYSNWQYTTADAGLCGLTPGLNYRSFNLACAGYPVEVGGTPRGTYPAVTWMPPGPQLPTGAPVLAKVATCAYAGPTRVVLNGNTATVTSPETTSTWVSTTGANYPAQCYLGVGAQGMANQTVSLTSPVTIHIVTAIDNGTPPSVTPAIAHGSSGWPTTGQQLGTTNSTPSTADSVFDISSPAATSPDSGTATASDSCTSTATYTGATASANCQWSDTSTTQGSGWTADGTGWTKYSTGSCGTDATDKLTFECEYNGGSAATGQYALYRTAVKNALASATASYAASTSTTSTTLSCTTTSVAPASATSTQLGCLLQDLVKTANTSHHSAGYATPAVGDHQYVVVPGSTTTTTSTVQVGSAPSTGVTDPFFSTTTGTASTETKTVKKTTFTAGRQVYKCYGVVSAGACLVSLGGAVLGNQWGDGNSTANGYVPAFQVTITQTTYSNFVQGTSAVSSFPSMSDVTQYQMGTINSNGQGQTSTFGLSGPGDLYVEGTADHTMAVVASDDVVVTNNLRPGDPTEEALEIVGQNNVRVYHPVKCATSDTTLIGYTSPGFCPNDITGLYYGVQTTGRPDQQYVNLRSDLASLTVTAALFALGNASGHITCPQPPDGGGVCGGEFTVDNFSRGSGLGHLTEVGTLAMAHHAPVGQEWEVADTTGQTSRPYSGYQMAQQYDNFDTMISAVNDVSGVLQLTTTTSSLWHVVSVSSASNS